MTQVKTRDYAICDYGIEASDYFQGHGAACTKYEYAALGIGSTYAEALDDALESAAMMGFNLELEAEDQPQNWEGKGPSAEEVHAKYCEQEEHDACEHELWYHVGLRWN